MKILAVNSSPRKGGQSKTELMMTHLVEGMRSAGAEVTVAHLREKNVKNCLGCFSCWGKTQGQCVQKDDMSGELYPRWLESDLWVCASPLYHFTVNAAMKAFIERTLPILRPDINKTSAGRSYHPLREKHPATVALSVAGFAENSVFDQLSSYMKFVYAKGLKGEIYRPAAETMVMPPYKDKLDLILRATEQAGRELVEKMEISGRTLAEIQQPLK